MATIGDKIRKNKNLLETTKMAGQRKYGSIHAWDKRRRRKDEMEGKEEARKQKLKSEFLK